MDRDESPRPEPEPEPAPAPEPASEPEPEPEPAPTPKFYPAEPKQGALKLLKIEMKRAAGHNKTHVSGLEGLLISPDAVSQDRWLDG